MNRRNWNNFHDVMVLAMATMAALVAIPGCEERRVAESEGMIAVDTTVPMELPVAPVSEPAPIQEENLVAQDIGLVSMGDEELATQSEIEVLTRGPVHEAYAEPVVYDAQPGIIVSLEPPADIEEVPPEIKPEGDNIVWIPGYWGWDDG